MGSDCIDQFMTEIDKLLKEIEDVYSKSMIIKILTEEQKQHHATMHMQHFVFYVKNHSHIVTRMRTDHCHITVNIEALHVIAVIWKIHR